MLIVQRGKELGYKLSDEQFKTAVDSIKKDNKIENDEQFQAALKQENVTMADLRRNLERQMIISRVEQNEVFGKIAATEERGADLLRRASGRVHDRSDGDAARDSRVGAVRPPGPQRRAGRSGEGESRPDSGPRPGRRELREARRRFLSDAPSRANAGLIGPISAKDLSPDFQKLIETMKTGDVTPPIRTQRGYQILKLESSTGAQTMPFEQARDQIGDRVFTDKRQVEFKKYLEKLRREAIIEWKNPDIKKAYEQGLAEQAKSATAPAVAS